MQQTTSVNIVVTDGVNYVLDTDMRASMYRITGTETLTTNWAVTALPGGSPFNHIKILYSANVTLGGNHIYILGELFPDNLSTKVVCIEAFYDGSAWIISFMPDFEAVSIVATDDIMDDAVTNDKLASITRGYVKVGGVADAPTDLDAKTSGQILVGDGTDVKSVPLSADATLASTGALTIAANAVTNTKLAAMTRGTIKVGGVSNVATDLNAKTSGNILIGNGTDIVSVPVTGDITISSAGVVSVIANGLWETGAGTSSIQTIYANTGCVSSGDYSLTSGYQCTASGLNAVAFGGGTTASGDDSLAIGSGTTASGIYSFCGGLSCTSNGHQSMALGTSCSSSGNNSIALGNGSIASGSTSFCQGHDSLASGMYSFAIGSENKASGTASTAIGQCAVAHIDHSFAKASIMFGLPGDAQKIDTILKVATTNNVTDYLQLSDGTDGLTIPTDCTANVDIRLVAAQTAGASGTIGDSLSQHIKLAVKNLAGVSSVLTSSAVTLANYSTVTGNILYELPFKDAAFGGTISVSVIANKIQIAVTGESSKDIQWVAYVSMVWTGYRNFSI